MTPADAEIFCVEDKDIVMVYAEGAGTRKVVFDDVLVRVHSSYALEFHVDVDEAMRPFSTTTIRYTLLRSFK